MRRILAVLAVLVTAGAGLVACGNFPESGDPCIDKVGRTGTWEWDDDLSDAMAARPSSRRAAASSSSRRRTVPARTSSTSSSKRHGGSGLECDADGG